MASRSPCRLRLAASVSRSTSASVRYSLVRNSAFGRRTGMATVRFSVAQPTSLRCDFPMTIRLLDTVTVRIIAQIRTVVQMLFLGSDVMTLAKRRCGRRSLGALTPSIHELSQSLPMTCHDMP